MGGVASAEDVIEFMLAGATAVQVGAMNLVDPFACKDIIENLPVVMKKYGISSLSEIIGAVQ
jgi:dihydroorotate dehydrogenase (NAD+) catalytic subunit